MVPIYVDGDIVLYESLAIMQFIERAYPDPPLMPSDPRTHALALMRMNEANNVSSAAGEVIYYVRRTQPEHLNLEYLTAKRKALYMEVALWEYYLRKVACALAAKTAEERSRCSACTEASLATVQEQIAEATSIASTLAGPGASSMAPPVVPGGVDTANALAAEAESSSAGSPDHRMLPQPAAPRELASQPAKPVDASRAIMAPVFLAGTAITLADISFFPSLAYLVRCGLDMTRFPFLNAYYDRMRARPSVQRTWPPHWRETPGMPVLSLTHMPRHPPTYAAPAVEDHPDEESDEDFSGDPAAQDDDDDDDDDDDETMEGSGPRR